LNRLKYKHLAVIFAVLFVLFTLPLFVIAVFAVPFADDFSYGTFTVHTRRETASVFRTMIAAVEGVQIMYGGWQGTFSAMFLMSLHPAVFNEDLYFIGPMLILLVFIVANLFLLKVVFVNYLRADKFTSFALSVLFVFILVQFIYSPTEGIFWYNASIFYTFFHSLALTLVSLVLLQLKEKKRSRSVVYLVVSCLAALVLGGGNYITALVTVVVLAFIVLYAFLKKKNFLYVLPVLCLLILTFVISVIAPGNAVRQANLESMNPFAAVGFSFVYAGGFIWHILSVPFLLALLILFPPMIRIVRNTTFQFPYPALIVALFYCVYAASFTPNLYANSGFGPARVLNINVYMLMFFGLFSCVYIIGYVVKKLERRKKEMPRLLSRPTTCALVALFVALAIGGYSAIRPINMSGLTAFTSLTSGEARQFHDEALYRRSILHDESIQNAVLPPFTAQPEFLMFYDISDDPNYWVNIDVANFYNKNSVVLGETP